MHWKKFCNPYRSLTTSFLQAAVVVAVEWINIANLLNIDNNPKDLIFDYIGFGIIAEFDDIFIELFRGRSEIRLLELDITYETFRKEKK